MPYQNAQLSAHGLGKVRKAASVNTRGIDHAHARAALNLGNLYYEIGRGSKGLMRRNALTKSRTAYRFFRSLGAAADAFDWFDLNLGTRARLREIDRELGPARPGTITWKDL